jgi:hypothetical protein
MWLLCILSRVNLNISLDNTIILFMINVRDILNSFCVSYNTTLGDGKLGAEHG